MQLRTLTAEKVLVYSVIFLDRDSIRATYLLQRKEEQIRRFATLLRFKLT